MGSFIAALQRRHVLRAAAFYAAAGWVLVQVATQVFPFFDIPNWVVRWVVIAIVLGFPAVLAFAWFYELTPQGLKLESQLSPAESAGRGGGRAIDRWIMGLLLLAVVLLLADKLVFSHRVAPDAVVSANGTAAGVADKSVAVLPFDNLSDDKSNAYFVQGMQDEILSRLARIGALKVISRTSSAQFHGGSGADLAQIAQQLGVANLLEGSVQRIGSRVHITVQLVQAASEAHVWGESYDRTLDDVFGVEAEVAQAVAQALQAQLSGGERQAIAVQPTASAAAYDAYLRGLGDEVRSFNAFEAGPMNRTEGDFAEAVRLDPDFALAWAHLAVVRSYQYASLLDHTPAKAQQAKDAADTALRLQPQLGEAYLAQGYYRYRVLKDYDGGLQLFHQAHDRLPNSAEALAAIAYIERRQGKWSESTAHLEQATALDPRNTSMLAGLALNYGALRQAPQALAAFDRALAVSPQDTDLLAGKAEVYTHSGDLDAAERLLQPIAFATAAPGVFGTKMQLLLLQRRFEDAIAGIQANAGRAEFADPINSANLDTELGMLQIFAGRPQAAQAPCTRALNTLQSLSATAADDADLGLLLASADYCLGRTAEAARIARRWMELNAGDALDFSKKGTVVVLAELAAGQDEDAYTLLAQLLQKPGGPTGADLRQNPYWDPVRKDPRFQKLLEAPVGS